MEQVIADTRLVCIRRDGERFDVAAQLGHPYRTPDGDWACPVSLSPLHTSLVDIHGVDANQALSLAASLLRTLLGDFVGSGGVVLEARQQLPVDVDAIFSNIGAVDDEP